MFVHSDEVKIDPAGRVHTFCHAVRGKWHMMGVNLSAGGSLQWFRNELCKAEIAARRETKIDPYDHSHRKRLNTFRPEAPGCSSFPICPASGRRMPIPMRAVLRRAYAWPTPRGHLVRSILEGVTYSMRDSLEIIRGLDIPVRQIRASGGGSRSPLWRQIQADVFGQKVVTINSEEGPAYGVALLAAVGAGAFKNIEEACRATIRVVNETRAATRRGESSRPGVSRVSAVVSFAEGRLQTHRRTVGRKG